MGKRALICGVSGQDGQRAASRGPAYDDSGPKGSAQADISRARLEGVARELERDIDTTVIEPGVGGFVWIGSKQDRFGPARDNVSGVRVICSGQLVFSAHDWSRAGRLPYEGGLGCRLILERYLSGGAEAVTPYNGSAIIVINDPRYGN